ncbi:MAG: DEDD exonuclease domain-containing protein [Austwickia sp.]|nr:DEDD exonuclease domain-containing protein [Austwickia sp.]MBK9100840.1 DEDD exonuclease domain-containing protein [Austwickia sp.]
MQAVQGTLDEIGTTLAEVTFVVVDLETTGGSAAAHAITEIGAVKVRGGEVLGEFQTLVNPGCPIPPFIAVLTGITDSMVATAPPLAQVLPSFLEFTRGAVLVAHNAPFDVSFLKAGAAQLGLPWPRFDVVDTAHLARQLVTRDEAPNRKLATLAALFGAATTPDHRALHDARATVDVLHALIARVGNLGVDTLPELVTFTSRVSAAQRRKRHLAEHLPATAGVYVFKDVRGRALYVGTSTDIRRRVRSYFTAAEQRSRMAEMVGIAESVTAIVCATPLEAQVRELRLIAEHDPRYNRRSRRPERRPWIKLTAEAFPRLSVVHRVRDDGATYAGPFGSRSAAQGAIDALHDVLPLRQCTARISPRRRQPACVLADLGRCGAPCTGAVDVATYAEVAARAAGMLGGDGRSVRAALLAKLADLAAAERYEAAAVVRDRMHQLIRGAALAQRVAPLAGSRELVAARALESGGWEFISVRYGRLAGTARSPAGADPMPYIDAMRTTAEVVCAQVPPQPAATSEETGVILSWLEAPGTRVVHLDGQWASPMHGAGAATALMAAREPRDRWAPAGSWGEPRAATTLTRPPGAVPSAAPAPRRTAAAQRQRQGGPLGSRQGGTVADSLASAPVLPITVAG